jgi:APA family basic amino acid/polyamine antiporter
MPRQVVVSAQPAQHGSGEHLRRDISVWGSFMWGYADVGADIYAALGIVVAASQGLAPLAFAVAGCVYILIGLAYTELASSYPVAGGGQYYTARGLGDFWGFVAGSALLLDYTIDIALFAAASAGYVNFFIPAVRDFSITIGPLRHLNPLWAAETVVLILFLVWLNIRGIRESSLFNEIIGAVDMVTESSVIILGFLFAWRPELLVHQFVTQQPTFGRFMYGSSLAIISYVGLESISQAAQETRRPATIIPRTSLGLIFSVLLFAMAFSTLGIGMLPWQQIAAHQGDPVALLAHNIPLIGVFAGPFAAIMGGTILLISANTGVMGSSRLTFSMSGLGLASKWMNTVHPRFRTPYRTIVLFSVMAIVEALLSFLTPEALDTLGNMYAFGATLAYLLVFVSLVRLRFVDPVTPRPYHVPFNIPWRHGGEVVRIPVLGFLGVAGVSLILFEVILTHQIGRIAGPGWVLLSIAYYIWFRRRQGYPVWRSLERHWETDQIAILKSAEEYELLEAYQFALAAREKARGRRRQERGGSAGGSAAAATPHGTQEPPR